jgi:hypothetical protein
MASCKQPTNAVSVAQFLEAPDKFSLPVTVAGVLAVRDPHCFEGSLAMELSPGHCGGGCVAPLALIPEASASFPTPARGIALQRDPKDSLSYAAVCHGDLSALCCDLPIDGKIVAASFRPRQDLMGAATEGRDYQGLVVTDICRVVSAPSATGSSHGKD